MYIFDYDVVIRPSVYDTNSSYEVNFHCS